MNFHKLKSYSLISKPHVFKDEIIRLNLIQDERVFSCCLFKGRCYLMSDAGISENQRKKNSDCIEIVHFISIDDQEGYRL